MASTNFTTHYSIPLPLGTDLTTPMDYNEAAEDIDTALFGAVTDASNAAEAAGEAVNTANTASAAVEDIGADLALEKAKIVQLQTRMTAAENEIDDVYTDVTDMITAYKEPSATSTHAYAIGNYFIYNETLYKTTAAIAIGATIVPNTNCEATNVSSELIKINNDLTNITDVVLSSGYTITDRQTRVKNGVAYLTFNVEKSIDSTTPAGNTALILGGVPKPLLDGGANSLIVPCTVYTTGNRELGSSLTIGTTGAIDFIITQEMVDIASEVGSLITLQIICNVTYLVDEN